MKAPSAGRAIAGLAPVGSHSQTRPSSTSSQDSQVPHGVGPPAQFVLVFSRIRYASVISPFLSKRMPDAPPMLGTSELTARIQPPSGVGKVAEPSGKIGKT